MRTFSILSEEPRKSVVSTCVFYMKSIILAYAFDVYEGILRSRTYALFSYNKTISKISVNSSLAAFIWGGFPEKV